MFIFCCLIARSFDRGQVKRSFIRLTSNNSNKKPSIFSCSYYACNKKFLNVKHLNRTDLVCVIRIATKLAKNNCFLSLLWLYLALFQELFQPQHRTDPFMPWCCTLTLNVPLCPTLRACSCSLFCCRWRPLQRLSMVESHRHRHTHTHIPICDAFSPAGQSIGLKPWQPEVALLKFKLGLM